MSGNICDHPKCTTAFCPYCGEVAGDVVAKALYKHVKRHVSLARTNLNTYRAHLDNSSGEENKAWLHNCTRTEAVVAKWTAWESWVAEHIAKDAEQE